MPPPHVICAGLSCLDLELHNTRPPETLEQITSFSHTTQTPGGSAPQTSISLSALRVPTTILTLLGLDAHAETLLTLLDRSGVDTRQVVRDSSLSTALSVLPVFTDGRRGCFVTLGSNAHTTADRLLSMLDGVDTSQTRVFHFGYPHLMPLLQGAVLAGLLARVRARVPGVRLSLDLNGADAAESARGVLAPALRAVDFVHANLEEACVVSGLHGAGAAAALGVRGAERVVRWFAREGLVVAVTAGKNGVFMGKGDAVVYRRAFEVEEGVVVNASGAGDAFVAGVLAVMAREGMADVSLLADAGMASALKRIESGFGEGMEIMELVELARTRGRIAPSGEFQDGK